MPKKVAPFWAFYKRYENEQRNKGRKFTKEEMHKEASLYWEGMCSDDRSYFVEDAKKTTEQMREAQWLRIVRRSEAQLATPQPAPPQPAPSCSEPNYSPFENMLECHMERVMEQIRTHPGGIREMEFCFFDANIQCIVQKRRHNGSESTELRPCELSLCRYSVEKGIINRWHGIIYTGNPFGMSRKAVEDAKFHCNYTHGIPFQGLTGSARNIKQFWRSVQDFRSGCALVTDLKYRDAVGSLIYILDKCGITEVPSIIDAGRLMDRMLESVGHEPNPRHRNDLANYANISTLEEEEMDMSCSFHNSGPGWKYCVLLRMTKLAFEFSRILAAPFEVAPLIPGVHIAANRGQIPLIEYKERRDEREPLEECNRSGNGARGEPASSRDCN